MPNPCSEHDLQNYLVGIVHSWSKTLAVLGFTLVPLFFILDIFTMPKELLLRFGIYRLVATVLVAAQYWVLKTTKPGRLSQFHGYFFAVVVGGVISLMTTDLGGFNSPYYAGLNLVMIAVTLLVPWELVQSMISPLIIIGTYTLLNVLKPHPDPQLVEHIINNLYFLTGTAICAVAINHVKQKVIRQEYYNRLELQAARDALWGEMEVAKHIQTALLPRVHRLPDYEVAATMLPADEVGGDYYDIIQTPSDETWISIGDVSGHGVESGLIMMMTQTSIFTTVNRTPGYTPSQVLEEVNSVIKKNISRLGTDRYMTISAIRLDGQSMTFAGKHQDILVYRPKQKDAEYISTDGTWLGLVDDLSGLLTNHQTALDVGDTVLLFTDGITEATNDAGEMFGEERLRQTFIKYADSDIDNVIEGVISDVREYMAEQDDDLTLLAVRRAAHTATPDIVS